MMKAKIAYWHQWKPMTMMAIIDRRGFCKKWVYILLAITLINEWPWSFTIWSPKRYEPFLKKTKHHMKFEVIRHSSNCAITKSDGRPGQKQKNGGDKMILLFLFTIILLMLTAINKTLMIMMMAVVLIVKKIFIEFI